MKRHRKVGLVLAWTLVAGAPALAQDFPPSLKTVPVPLPDDLLTVVADLDAARLLGKALFWDMQIGSDGIQACGTCHFAAGTDPRLKNQINPGPGDVFDATATGGMGPNYTPTAGDFPFRQLADPQDNESEVLFDTDDRLSLIHI